MDVKNDCLKLSDDKFVETKKNGKHFNEYNNQAISRLRQRANKEYPIFLKKKRG